MPSIVFLVSVCLLGDPLVLRVPKNEIVTKHIETRVNRSWPVLCAASESLQAALVTAPKAPLFFSWGMLLRIQLPRGSWYVRLNGSAAVNTLKPHGTSRR
jgi:hypothetical protein